MFYVSSLEGDKIGITDTRDGKEEFYSNREVVGFKENAVAKVFGVSVFNHKADCTVLKLDRKIRGSDLKKLLSDWKKVHNPWTGIPVECYLAEAKIGTRVIVDYVATSDGDRHRHRGTTILKKLSYDEWYYKDTTNMMSDKTGDSEFAAWCLEVSCIYSRPVDIAVF